MLSVFADFLAPNPPDAQNLDRHFSPPAAIHFRDDQGRFHWRPFVYGIRLVDPLDTVYQEDRSQIHYLFFLQRGYEYRALGLFQSSLHLVGCESQQCLYLLGTDELGRDILARILAGSQTSLIVVILGLVAYSLLGTGIGAAAALTGPLGDSMLMRFSEFVLALPALYIILALRALLPLKIPYWEAVLIVTGTIAAVTWPPMARGVRGLIFQLRGAGFVEAAHSMGCTRSWILRYHMLPALIPYVLQQALVAAPSFILGEIVLSFLDVGVSGAGVSWGAMLKNLRDPRLLTDFWWNLAPLMLAFLTLLSMNLISSRWQRREATRSVL